MANEIVTRDELKNELVANRRNYVFKVGDYSCPLIRDVDFGKVPKAKRPSLWKSGAEKVLLAYGLYYETEIVDSYKDYEKGFFYYEVVAKAYDQNGKVVRTGVGCANTSESRTGTASGFNTANSALKLAKKRSIVDLALTLGSLSDGFTQDLEDETNAERAKEVESENDYISPKQVQRIFAIASNHGITTEKAKAMLKELGYDSSKSIPIKDYDMVCEKFQKADSKE